MSFLEKYNSIIKPQNDFLKTLQECLVQKQVFDVSAKNVIVLDAIGDKKLTVGELRNYSSVFFTNPTYNINKLHENGYIKKQSAQFDKRTSIIELTEKAAKLLKDIYSKYKELYA